MPGLSIGPALEAGTLTLEGIVTLGASDILF